MPGPGGGARGGGGGFHGGGGGGGGFRGGGGFGGPPHGGGWHHRPPHHHGGWHHRPFYGGWHHRPYYGGGGGGCLGGVIGAILAPIILAIVVMVFIFASAQSAFGWSMPFFSQGSSYTYDENALQDYADERYAAEFGDAAAYEDNILLVVLTESENYSQYAYIAWVGDHVATDVNYMFGNDGTELGAAMDAAINTNSYKYSLDSNLAAVIATMQQEITGAGLTTPFTCEETRDGVSSHLTNRTELELTEQTVNAALQSFTSATGIPMVVVVDDMDEVFESALPTGSLIWLVVGIGLVILVVWLIVRAVRKNRTNADGTEPEQVQ